MNDVICFNYLYRDSGNWKKFGSKRFANPDGLSLEEIEQIIRHNLIDQEYFYPDQVGIKKFKFHRYLDDNSWYEFESVEAFEGSNSLINKLEPISNLLLRMRKDGRF